MGCAGVPPGVVNMVFGRGDRVGACLAAHPKVPLISFTGGTATGTKIRMAALNSCKKLSLEVRERATAIFLLLQPLACYDVVVVVVVVDRFYEALCSTGKHTLVACNCKWVTSSL